jgi:hypothetical protein
MSFGSFSLSRSWTRVLDYARVYATVALVAGSHACIGLGFRLLRWSRVASGLPSSVFAHCVLEPFDWERSASGTTFARFERLYEDSWLSARVTMHGPTVSAIVVVPGSHARPLSLSAAAAESGGQALPSTSSGATNVETFDPIRRLSDRPEVQRRRHVN